MSKPKHDKTCKPNDLCDPCWDALVKRMAKSIERAKKAEPDHPYWSEKS